MTESLSVVAPRDASELDPYRLPRHVLPRRYDLSLEPDLAAARFTGDVVITCDALAPTRLIALNSVDLEIDRVHVDGAPCPFSIDAVSERLIIGLPDEHGTGPLTIDISFRGVLNDKLRGFYRSTYHDESGAEHVIACTQMQSTDCRRAFPCFDEPDFKAIFGTTLVVEDGLLAIANAPEVGRTPAETPGKSAVRFADTMVMSTYLVAFVVGRLETTRTVEVRGVPLRVVHVPGKAHLTEFALDVGARSLEWFTDYYGIPYADAKIDMVALPDFAAGAMENVGCITYRENLLLVDPRTSTQTERELVADVVSHELAHMWFGDLVTMKWWNGIWLNEAFATFMEVAAVDAYRPSWDRWTNFSLERSAAFETDSLRSTRPVEFEVRSPTDCEGMFDVLTYQKGGSLLRMLEQYLGETRFRDGVREYLTAHSYRNTETSDLWDSIERAVSRTGSEPVRAVMDSWIWQPGHPLVSAEIVRNRLRLSQRRFSFDPGSDDDGTRWLVPVHVRVGGVETKQLLRDGEISIDLADPNAVVVVNAGGHGFYRVAYSPELLRRIDRRALDQMSTIERYNLVDDAWNAVVAGRLTAADFLDFLGAFEGERELAVWQCIGIALRTLARLTDVAERPRFEARVRALVAPALVDLGWDPVEGETDLRGQLRGVLIVLSAIIGGDAAVVERCRASWRAALADATAVHPEIAAAATTVVAATGGADEYAIMLDRFEHGDSPQEQLRNLYALAEFDSAELVARTCELAMSGRVKTQNAPFVLARCIANRHHGRQAWRFVREIWDRARREFPNNTIVRMVDPVKILDLPSDQADVAAFFAEHPIPQSAKTLEQLLERQRVNVALRTREATRFTRSLAD